MSLSATVSNAEEFGAWLGEVRGDTEVIVSEHRPVPLWQHMMVGQTLFDLFVEERDAREDDEHFVAAPGRYSVAVNPDLVHAIRGTEGRGAWDSHWVSSRGGRDKGRPAASGGRGGPGGGAAADDWAGAAAGATTRRWSRGPGGGDAGRGFSRGGRPGGGATRAEVIERLEREGLLPAITFIFSRAGCDGAVGPAPVERHAAHPRVGGRGQPSPRRGAHPGPGRGGPRGARLLGLRRRHLSWVRRAPRRHAADLPRDRRGALHRRPGPGRLRHRDAGARHQHARAHRRAREAGQVQR